MPAERRISFAVMAPAFSVVAAGMVVEMSPSFHAEASLSYACLFAVMVTVSVSCVLERLSSAAFMSSSFLNAVEPITPA